MNITVNLRKGEISYSWHLTEHREAVKIVYRLGTLALKIKDIREATDCYEEFVKLAPKDPESIYPEV